MKKYVFTIKDDVCAANGKDIEATELLQKMKLWGDVEPYEKALAPVCNEYDGIIHNLNTQLTAIKAQELTPDEIVLLNTYRDCKAVTGEAYEKRITGLENCLEEVRVASQKRAQQIAQLVAELQEVNA